jgi:hypothetical protein
MDCALPWLLSVLLWLLIHLGKYGVGCEPFDVLPCETGEAYFSQDYAQHDRRTRGQSA